MRGILLAYSFGVLLATFVLHPAQTFWMLGAGIGLLVPVYPLLKRIRQCWWISWRMALAMLVGGVWHCTWANSILADRIPAHLEGRDMSITGIVTSLPAVTDRRTQFQFYIEQSDLGFSNRRVLLNYYGDQFPEAGQRWSLRVRLNKPKGFANPGGFDYEAWLFQQRISARGYVRDHPENRLLGDSPASLPAVRDALRKRITDVAGDLPGLGLLLALGLGDQSQLQPADWQLMSKGGLNHLFVISGLHISLVAMVVYWLCNGSLRWVPLLSAYYPRQKSALWCALAAALLYSLLAGFSLPTQRAFIMTAIFILGQISSRPVPVSARFLFALAIVLTGNPLSGLNAGFWLSFVAVAALLLCLNETDQHEQSSLSYRKLLRKWFAPQLVVFFALTPFLLFWVQQISLLSPLLNVFAIPLVGLLAVPMILMAMVLLILSDEIAFQLFLLSDFTLQSVLRATHWITTRASWSLVEVQTLPYFLLLCIATAMLVLLAPCSRSLRLLAIPLLLPAVFQTEDVIADKAVNIHVLDVGQGLSVIAQTRNHALVYDTGAALSPEFDLGAAVVMPVLGHLGISSVDSLVISHFDNDHSGGLAGLLPNVRVDNFISSDPHQAQRLLNNMQVKSPELTVGACTAGESWQWDGVKFNFLHPQEEELEQGSNNSSCVLRISTGDRSVLLPGDIERAAEHSLALQQRLALSSDIVLAPHHGSNTSSTYAFIKNVRPDFVIYAAGYRNSFGHPTARVRQRYREAGAREFFTHESGMLSFHLTPDLPLEPPRQYRQVHRRYWH